MATKKRARKAGATRKRRLGRPPKPPEKLRVKAVRLTFNLQEQSDLEHLQATLPEDKALAVWCREAVIKAIREHLGRGEQVPKK